MSARRIFAISLVSATLFLVTFLVAVAHAQTRVDNLVAGAGSADRAGRNGAQVHGVERRVDALLRCAGIYGELII